MGKPELSFAFMPRVFCNVDDDDGTGHGGSSCPFCEAVPTICKIITGLVDRFKDELDKTVYNKWMFQLEQAELAINNYKKFVLRSLPSINVWNNLMQRKDPHQAFLTIGNRVKAEL